MLWGLFYKDTNPIYLPETSLPNAIAWGMRASMHGFGGTQTSILLQVLC